MPIKKPRPSLPDLKKGTLLIIKTPPYYSKEYLYEVVSAGEKLIRAELFHSPTVRKSWSREELAALFEHGIIRSATEGEAQKLSGTPAGDAKVGCQKELPSDPED